MSETTKMTVNLNSDAVQALKELARIDKTSMTVAVNKAILLDKYLKTETKENGGEIQIVYPNGITKTTTLR